MNIFIINCYGLSETSGPHALSEAPRFSAFDDHALSCTGHGIEGTTTIVYNPDNDGNGEICFKGRNRFMGYLKKLKTTRKTIDN